MGTLYLVRHAQASLGAADYDRLSPLGEQQAARLGQYWAERRVRVDAVLTGTLHRHAQTWQALAQAASWPHTPVCLPGLDEYDSGAVIRAALALAPPQPASQPPRALGGAQGLTQEFATAPSSDGFRAHFRALRHGLALWMAGQTAPQGMPAWGEFQRSVVHALDQVRASHAGQTVLIVSSGGPIATALGHVLGLPAQSTIELNMRIRNCSVSECVFSPKRFSLLTFNTLPHLDQPEHRGWITYA